MRPKRLTATEAVRQVLMKNPAAWDDHALLVRLVWEMKDAYFTDEPADMRGRLTDPWTIVKAKYILQRQRRRLQDNVDANRRRRQR